jgi:hypothetical protein
MRARSSRASWGVTLLLASAACESGSPSAPASTAPQLSVEVDVNGRSAAPFDADCSRGLFVSTRVKNLSSRPLQVQRLAMTFESLNALCQTSVPGIDPTVDRSLAPGEDEEIRVFDAAGNVCGGPYGGAGCSWHTTATVFTNAGSGAGTLDFYTDSRAPRRGETGCEPPPVIYTPHDGDTVSGTVDVTSSVGETSTCINIARSLVTIYSERQIIVGTAELDLGLSFHWDTRRVANGRYSIRARQNCCLIEGPAVTVTVHN